MKKWFLVPISLLTLFLPNEVQDTSYTIDSTIIGMKYGFYEDIDCKIPILDSNHSPMILEMEDKEDYSFSFEQEQIYIKQLETVDGYYFDDEVHSLKQHTTLPIYPITLKYESDLYPTSFVLKDDQDQVIKQWDADQQTVPDIVYVAGESYTLEEKNPLPYTIFSSMTISIPYAYDSAFDAKISIQHETYGTMLINVFDEEEHPIEHVKYALYQNNEIVKDINQKECIQESDENGLIQFSTQEGIYELQQIDIPDTYYRNQTKLKVEVKEKETNSLSIHENHVTVTFSTKDAETKNGIPASIWINECNQSVKPNEKVFLKRNTSYSFKDLEHPNGYYACESMSFQTSEEKQDQNIEVLYQPFTVTFQVYDVDTNQPILSNKYAIYDVNQNEVLSFTMQDAKYQTSSLRDGVFYTLKEIETTNGYLRMEDISFVIENQQREISLQAYKTPYTFVQSKIVDEQGNLVQGKIGIYADETCTSEIKDINGNVIDDLHDYSIRNGIYYIKLKDLDTHYLWNDEVKKIVINHDHAFFSFQVKDISFDLQIQNTNGNQLKDVQMQLLDADGNVILTFMNQDDIHHYLERECSYSVRIAHINGLYTYEKKEKVFFSNEETKLVFECDPYIDLKIKGNGLFALYEDHRCTYLSKDMYGIETKKSGNSIEWLMREGTYYLKQIEPQSGDYGNIDIVKVQLKEGEWSYVQEIQNEPMTLNIQILGEEEQLLDGSAYEILDSDGNILDTITQSNDSYQAEWLKPSLQVVFHEIKTPQGYQSNPTDLVYTLPDTIPSSHPSIVLKYTKEIKNSIIPQKELQTDEKEMNHSFSWVIYCGIVVSGLLIAVLVYYFHH